jgi:acyl homoserine lactone synthase
MDEIVAGLIEAATANGADELMTLSSLAVLRALRGLGFDVHRMGERYRDACDGRLYAVMSMPVERATHLMAAE